MVANQNLPPTRLYHIFMLDLLSFAGASGKVLSNMDEGTSFAGKMQVFLPTPPSGGFFAFSGDGLVPSKPKLP